MKAATTFAAVFFFIVAGLACGQTPSVSSSAITEARYQGSWKTTKNKKLDGKLTCQVTPLAKDRWRGRFWGVWQQVPFDYTVDFATSNDTTTSSAIESPTQNRVRGTATIDGAHYDWAGTLTPDQFDINFAGSRYDGSVQLTRLADKHAALK